MFTQLDVVVYQGILGLTFMLTLLIPYCENASIVLALDTYECPHIGTVAGSTCTCELKQ